MATDYRAVQALSKHAFPLTGTSTDFDLVVERCHRCSCVLIGEASHGTHEFYRARALITQRLISEAGFHAVAIEGDWPDTTHVHHFVTGQPDGIDAVAALGGFVRFPQWMWRNADMVDFVTWLHRWNGAHAERPVGIYGLDLYSLHASVDAVLRYLRDADPPAAARAMARYACFDTFGGDMQSYGHLADLGLTPSCEDAVVTQLMELRSTARREVPHTLHAREEHFFAEQNARLVANAERYYRTMMRSHVSSWNLRDRHMAETLDMLVAHLTDTIPSPRLVVWAHNSHVGDARATERRRAGELNLGQLARDRFGSGAFLIGFSTHSGTVTAADDWGEAAQRKRVRFALPGSYEALFHVLPYPNFCVDPGHEAVRPHLEHARLQRAIGVIYRPDTERQSHYYHTTLPDQFNLMIHYDETRAVEPLERTPVWESGEPPETWPSAL